MDVEWDRHEHLQLSDFTLQNHKMSLLDPTIMKEPDFQETRQTALRDASDVACAEMIFFWSFLINTSTAV